MRDKQATSGMVTRAKADLGNPLQIGAPMKGDVVDLKVKVGDQVKKGQVVAVISAMKMEMAVQANADGVVVQMAVDKGDKVEGDDLLVEIE